MILACRACMNELFPCELLILSASPLAPTTSNVLQLYVCPPLLAASILYKSLSHQQTERLKQLLDILAPGETQ